MRAAVGVIALFAASAAACLSLFASSGIAALTRAAGTSIHLYTPFNGDGVAVGIKVARSVSGYCWTTSSVAVRSDAYRCFVGNYIHDPCFANGNGGASTFVLCPLYLPQSKVMRINLTKALPPNSASGDPTRFPPWAVQLTNGKWCEILSGATGQVAGMRINYGCGGGAVLIGDPRRSTSTWTIFYAPRLNANQYQPVSIRSAWW